MTLNVVRAAKCGTGEILYIPVSEIVSFYDLFGNKCIFKMRTSDWKYECRNEDGSGDFRVITVHLGDKANGGEDEYDEYSWLYLDAD